MELYLFSSNGVGAGKTFMSTHLCPMTLSLADAIRTELHIEYPHYRWYSKDQSTKNMIISETGLTMRQMMVERGQSRCESDPLYWCKKVGEWILENGEEEDVFGIDDIRKVYELEYFRTLGIPLAHWHIIYDKAIPEQAFESQYAQLEKIANVIVNRR